jgi:ATP-dependent Clp protease ATP-binding subunit ClpA
LGSAPKRSDDKTADLDEGLDGEEVSSDSPADNPFSDVFDGSEEVPYELIGHKWDTPGVHLNVRQYEDSEEARVLLLGGVPFESKRGFHLLIVQLCIEDFADVLHLLDKTGVSKLHSPNTLIAELYEIAVLYNSHLKLENLDLKALRQRFKELNKTRNRRVSAEAGAEPRQAKRRGIKFTDVPQDKILELGTHLRKRIQGQDEALDLVSDAVARATVGLKRKHEPLGVFLFTGNSGVGKTETAKALAQILGAHLVRIDCQEYQHQHEVAKLTGSPPGYIGYDDGGHLTKEVTKYPFSVVLFDEIEKAHGDFHERVLQIVDDGVLTESKGGNKVSFDETIIIMTSNIGVKEIDALGSRVGIGAVSLVSNKDAAKARGAALKHKFKPEFLNRIDEVVHFRLLDSDNYLQILEILLDEVQDQLSDSRNIALNFNVGAKNFLIEHGVDAKYGARPLRRSIKRHLNTPLSKAILKGDVSANTKITVSLKPSKDGLAFRTTGKKKVVSAE